MNRATPGVMRKHFEASRLIYPDDGLISGQPPAPDRTQGSGAVGRLRLLERLCRMLELDEGFIGRRYPIRGLHRIGILIDTSLRRDFPSDQGRISHCIRA